MARPLKYETPKEMQAVIDEYFDGDAWFDDGENRYFAPTVAGLALALDLSRQGLLEYTAKSGEFSDTIKKAKQRIEIALERRLHGNAVTGTIFNLKNNFGWKDKQEVEHSGGLSDLTEEQIDARLAELLKSSE